MSDSTQLPRRRPLWPLFVMPALVLVAAVVWSAFWFYAASQVDQAIDVWRAREATAGRIFDCPKRSVAGFPFRLEVTCEDAGVTLVAQTAHGAAATPVNVKLGRILVVGQVYTPGLLIAEFTAPATLAVHGGLPTMRMDWKVARSSIAGLPGTPQRVALVFDAPALDRLDGDVATPLARAVHAELHTELAASTTPDHPVIDVAVELDKASAADIHPVLAAPFDALVGARVTGLRDLEAKPWPQRFREIQAAGGRIEIVRSRVQQGDLIAVAAGSLGLDASGNLDGELQMTVAGLAQVIPLLGIEQLLEQGVPQATLDRLAPGMSARDVNSVLGSLDRMIPGLGKAVRQNAGVGLAAAVNALGSPAELEGKPARAFPLRFAGGAVLLGPVKVGQIPPLF
ncbi:MAG: DUF2125 domain-containing protein [Xanthobacteraceae bacterium]